MSGSTIGGVVGGAIGWLVGGPAGAQWGWMIGGTVGAIVDPQRIEGPRLGEAKTQTAQDGVPLIYGYGTFPCAGNVAWVDEVKEHRHKEGGKGGPEQVTYTYTISYMVVVCKGEISGYKLIRRNGKVVYDARTDAELLALGYTSQEIAETRAAQAEFLQRATLYYGTNDQMPDPTMVAVKGGGEVPAYTGIAYIVMTDDETREGEYAQFEFVVANCGERREEHSIHGQVLVTGSPKSAGAPMYAIASVDDDLEFQGIPQSTGATVSGHPSHYDGATIVVASGGAVHTTNPQAAWEHSASHPSLHMNGVIGGHSGWLAYNHTGSLTGNGLWYANRAAEEWQLYYPETGVWYISYADGYYWMSAPNTLRRAQNPAGPWTVVSSGGGVYSWVDIIKHDSYLYATCRATGVDTGDWQIRRSSDGGATWSSPLLSVSYIGRRPYFLCSTGGHVVAWCIGGGVWTDADNWSYWYDTGVGGSSTGGTSAQWIEGGRKIVAAEGLAYVIGPDDKLATFDPLTLEVGGPITVPINAMIGIAYLDPPAGLTPIPDAPGFYIDDRTGDIIGPSGTQIDQCQPSLGEIVADQCERRGVASRDVSELVDLVDGYRVAAPSSSQRNIQGLQPGFFFSASEFDGALHFPKRGRDLTFALTHDDFVERDGEPIQWERSQEAELLRKVTVAYVDPDTTYTPTTQQAERRSATIDSQGEGTIELPVTGSKDWAAQVADKSIKVAWGETEECTFHVTIDHAELVVGAEGTVPYLDGSTTVVRIERIEDEGLVRMVTARRTRKNLYESNASGAAKPLPRFPGSNIRGPTDGLLLNIPVLIDQDDHPGIHWAAGGMTSGWRGGRLQIYRAGQWTTVGDVTNPAGMGTLLAPLPAHSGDVDAANVLSVRFNEELESVTWVNLLQERNPLAILKPGGTAEIIQFESATAVAPGQYDLTTLLRGRLATTPGDHDTGARVVLLDTRVQYASLEPTDVGQTLQYRFVSMGTNPDDAPIQTITLTTMESQREWPVYMLHAEQDGDDYTLTWLARDRLGTDVLPIRSLHWGGYEVSYSHPGGSGSVVVNTETHTFNLPGASDITFSVAQLNQYTGAGPDETVHIP